MNLAMARSRLLIGGIALLVLSTGLHAQDARSAEIIALNRALVEAQILEADPSLLERTALDQFLVIAPGGLIESKARAMRGTQAWDVVGIEISEEQVIFSGTTAVLVGKLVIDGEMQPVGRFGPMKFMAVFVESDGEWKLMARSNTLCIEMAIKRGFC